MRKNLVFYPTLVVLFVSMLSFSFTNNKYVNTTSPVTKKHKVHKTSNCTASITGVTLVSATSSSATITITYSGTPDHFKYGGYYNGVTGNPSIPSTNLYSTTVVIPMSGACGARVWFQCVCSDGTTVGATHGVLFGCGDATIYF
jgi:hypothetical protein